MLYLYVKDIHVSSLIIIIPSLQKHSTLPPEDNISPFSDNESPLPSVSEEEVARAIMTVSNVSEGGPDGLRPYHRKDLTEPSAGNGVKSLLIVLSLFSSLVIQGKKVPTFICQEQKLQFNVPDSTFTLYHRTCYF